MIVVTTLIKDIRGILTTPVVQRVGRGVRRIGDFDGVIARRRIGMRKGRPRARTHRRGGTIAPVDVEMTSATAAGELNGLIGGRRLPNRFKRLRGASSITAAEVTIHTLRTVRTFRRAFEIEDAVAEIATIAVISACRTLVNRRFIDVDHVVAVAVDDRRFTREIVVGVVVAAFTHANGVAIGFHNARPMTGAILPIAHARDRMTHGRSRRCRIIAVVTNARWRIGGRDNTCAVVGARHAITRVRIDLTSR